MATTCQQPLQDSPFLTYRDPCTGKWLVIPQFEPEKSDFCSNGQRSPIAQRTKAFATAGA